MPFSGGLSMIDATTTLEALSTADLDAGTVFSGSPSGKIVRGFATATPFTPDVVT
jgi:cobaltochelatase CobS